MAALGLPAQLLRRRPDIRRAEGQAAAQCALIGVAVADLLPHFNLFGSIGYFAENPGNLFSSSSLSYQMGTGIRWDIFNYGRIINNVRVQDARFEQLLEQYKQTVLTAQQEVSDAINAFTQTRKQAGSLSESVQAAVGAVRISMIQYKAGGADFIRVLNATQILVQSQDQLAATRVNEALSVISLNRALGGGWELRQDDEFLPPDVIRRMRDRTNWGDIASRNYKNNTDLGFPRPNITRPRVSNSTATGK
jgi:outer membrane protein TolC